MNIFFDLEWRRDGKIFLLGWARNTRHYGFLYGKKLTKTNIVETFAGSSFVFVWGPDCGKIENAFDFPFRQYFRCVNLLSVVRDHVKAKDYKLTTIERKFNIPRMVDLKDQREDIYSLWIEQPQTVLEYTLQDVLSLYVIEQTLRDKYGLTAYDFRQYELT